jgi:hypothetical protein
MLDDGWTESEADQDEQFNDPGAQGDEQQSEDVEWRATYHATDEERDEELARVAKRAVVQVHERHW